MEVRYTHNGVPGVLRVSNEGFSYTPEEVRKIIESTHAAIQKVLYPKGKEGGRIKIIPTNGKW